MSAGAALCLLAVATLLPAGNSRTVEPYSPPLKTSSFSMTKNMCTECTQIMELFFDMLSKPDTQPESKAPEMLHISLEAEGFIQVQPSTETSSESTVQKPASLKELIKESLNELCRRLPGTAAVNDCFKKVENYLPVVIKALISFTVHKEGDICMVLGLCTVQPESNAPEMLHVSLEADGFIQTQPSTQTNPESQVQITPQCTFCLFIIRKLEDMLPKERTEESIVKALEAICNHLPDHYKDQCNSFLETYGKQILDFLLTSATPHTICALLHLCLMQDRSAMVPYMPSDCQSCRTLVILTQIRIGQNATELQTSSALWKTCFLHPNALPGCELFVQRHGVTLTRILSKQEAAVTACQKFFCVGQE